MYKFALSAMVGLASWAAVAAEEGWRYSDTMTQGLSYNYVQGGYLRQNFNGVPIKADGYTVGVSGLLTPELFVFGDYADARTDDFRAGAPPAVVTGNFKLRGYDAGLGLRCPLSMVPATDLNATAAWVREEVDGRGGFSSVPGSSDNGYDLALRARTLLTPYLEGNLGADYLNIGDDTHHFTGHATALVHLGRWFSLLGDYGYNHDGHSWVGGGRFNFGA